MPETAQVTVGGATLEDHWRTGEAQARILEGGWDAVVLQEQSLRPAEHPALMHEAARRFAPCIAAVGAQPLFYLTWARRHLPEMQEALDGAYAAIAGELAGLGARVVPVGPAWQRATAARPDLALHLEDDSHPTPAGSYLAAAVFYAVLSGQDPTDLEVVDVDAGDGGPATPVRLDAADARFLRETAWAAVAAPDAHPEPDVPQT